MPKNSISAQLSNLQQLVADLEAIENGGKKAISNTIKDVKARAPGWIAQEVTAVYNIKKSEITPSGSGKPKKMAGSIQITGGVLDAEVVEGCRAVAFTLGTPAVSMVGLVEEVLADRAFVPERRTSAAELGTLAIVWWVGSRGASSSANLQTLVAVLIVALIVVVWWRGGISPAQIPFPAPAEIDRGQLFSALSVMFWCFVGLEAFAHLASEFKHPERDFPRALMIGLLLAGSVYWACTVLVLHFHAFGEEMAAAASLPNIVVRLFGVEALWVACVIGYLACFLVLLFRLRWLLRLFDLTARGLAWLRLTSPERTRRIKAKFLREAVRFSRCLKIYVQGDRKDVFLSVFFTFIFLLSLFSFPSVLFWGAGYQTNYFTTTGLLVVST